MHGGHVTQSKSDQPSLFYTLYYGADDYDASMYTARHEEEKEVHKAILIGPTDTGVDPGTMMVHLHHTSIATPAMMRSGSLVAIAASAELQEHLILRQLWMPLQWNEARTNHQGPDEVVQSAKGLNPDEGIV